MANDPRETSFKEFFNIASNGFDPYAWQLQVAVDGLPDVLPVPTGLGKTEVALAWAWRLLVDKKPEPLHLVVCLPMRSLVTQTVQRLRAYFNALEAKKPEIDVAVHQLMGGAIGDEWVGQPDKPWVLVGTQDQLLSRALNRGYSMSRFEWPVHFGLLNNDCRWLIDEVQLMGPGLWTTSQLDWMRRKRFKSLKPCPTTWMSATVGTLFLSTTDRVHDALDEPSKEQIAFEGKLTTALDGDKGLEWWREAKRPLAWWQLEATALPSTGEGKRRGAAKSAAATVATPDAIAASVKAKHAAGTLSLVICNTVDMARAVFGALGATDHKVLLTSRFRREDRARHEQRLIDFDAQRKAGTLRADDPGLICVSTQVIEAGVDISAHRLFTELAPWPSLLQRLGRLNRKGDDQDAQAWVWETPKEGGSKRVERIGPYETTDIERAKKLVEAFVPLSQRTPFVDVMVELEKKHAEDIEKATRKVREAVADMTGKDAEGNALKGHRHTEFLAWCEDRVPTRLLVWRGSRPFDADEQDATLLAAARDVSWAAGSDSDEWKIRLVPLDRAVPPPPGFDKRSSVVWESVTPYVPSRHHLRGGKERDGESIAEQIAREVQGREIAQSVSVELLGSPQWVAVHVPRREANKRAFIGDRRGQMVRLRFSTPVAGPIRLGHSSSFGLGLFRPVDDEASQP